MPSSTDQLGRTITLDHLPRRIISLVPSQTELLHTLGAPVVGITKFCIHPTTWFQEKPRIGGTKGIDPDKIDALQPDLIIANKEENDRDQVEALAARYPVWTSDIHNLDDAIAMIRSVGELIGQTAKAQTLATDIEKAFSELTATPPSSLTPSAIPSPLRTVYFIWRNPWMTVGGDTFIHDMLQRCGLTNLFATESRYPVVDPSTLSNCDLVLLSSEPYPFRSKHLKEIQSLLPNAIVQLVDGELFSWYGSRLLQAPAYFRRLLTGLQPGTLI
jgi:ABC-type Fe3+-hydroxamate transport system substrate-binding protein